MSLSCRVLFPHLYGSSSTSTSMSSLVIQYLQSHNNFVGTFAQKIHCTNCQLFLIARSLIGAELVAPETFGGANALCEEVDHIAGAKGWPSMWVSFNGIEKIEESSRDCAMCSCEWWSWTPLGELGHHPAQSSHKGVSSKNPWQQCFWCQIARLPRDLSRKKVHYFFVWLWGVADPQKCVFANLENFIVSGNDSW